ncbi:MAG: hypothetical protein R3C29_02815 [Dehalococcoidia bacterium]
MLSRHWPKEAGSRNTFAMAVGGLLLRGLRNRPDAVEIAQSLVFEASKCAGDEEAVARRDAVTATYEKIGPGEPITGRPTLVRLGISEEMLKQFRTWLNLRRTAMPSPSEALLTG